MEYRKDIQGLRAIAALSVFLFHLNSRWLPGGFTGVDIFFVISGYLITSIILKNKEKGTFSFKDFYISRFKRIVPAYYFMLGLVAIAAAVIYIGDDIYQFKRELLRAFLFDSNRLYAKGASYFGVPTKMNPIVHSWTIAIEMKFYFLLPALLIFIPKKYITPVIIAVSVACFMYGVYVLEIKGLVTYCYYTFLVRVPEFCIGVLLVLIKDKLPNIPHRFKNVAGITGLLLLLYSFFFIDGLSYFPAPLALIPCLGTALIIMYSSEPVYSMLSGRIFEFTGTLSYSIYLWHAPVITLMRYYNGGGAFSLLQLVVIVLSTFICAWLSYTFIENVFRKKSTSALWVGVGSPAALAVIMYFAAPDINKKFSTIPVAFSGPVFGLESHAKESVETFGDTTKPAEILLIGNSHALCVKPYLDYIGKKDHFAFRTITTNSYPAIGGVSDNEAQKRGSYGDYKLSQQLIPLTKDEIKKSKIIILVLSSWKMVPSFVYAVEQLSSGLAKGQQLVLLTAFPVVNKDPLQINRGIVKNTGKEQRYKLRYIKMNKELLQLKQSHPNIHFYDLSKSDAFTTAPFYNDTIMYYNKNHINTYGALVLAKSTEKQFVHFLDSIR